MAKYYTKGTHHPIIFQMTKNNIAKIDVCKALGVCKATLDSYIKDYRLIRVKDLLTLSGLFGLSIEEFVYILVRHKPMVKKSDKKYLFDIRERSEDVL